MKDPTVPTTERALAAVLEHQMTAVGRGEVACGCTPGWMSTYTYYKHLARAVQALYAPLVAEVAALRAKAQRVEALCDEWQHLALPGMTYWDAADDIRSVLADPDDTAHPDTEVER